MTLSLSNQTAPSGDMVYYLDGFRAVFEDHIAWLRAQVDPTPVSPEDAYMYEFRLSTYLNTLKITPEFHWLTMRLNYWDTPSDFDQYVRKIYLPPTTIIATLASTYQTKFGSV